MNGFKRIGLGKLADRRIDVRCAKYDYQYSDIMLALFCTYFCGGNYIREHN